jgi:hypothetical protein
MKKKISNSLALIYLSFITIFAAPLTFAAQEPAQIDFSKISLDTLPPASSDFSFPATANIPAFEVKKGQRLVDTMPTGLLQAIKTKNYSPREIASIVGLKPEDLEQGQLGNLKYLKTLTIKNIVTAIPGLSNVKAESVPGLGGYGSTTFGDLAKDKTIGNSVLPPEVLKAATPKDLPGLMDTQYFDFKGIEKVPVADLTGIPQLPIDKSLNITIGTPGQNLQLVKLDRVAIRETNIGNHPQDKVASGSDIKPNSACTKTKECSYGELQSTIIKGKNFSVNGSKALEGKSNMVEGGRGLLKPVNGGQEPSNLEVPYISVNGFSAGISLENINQRQGTAEQVLNLRFGFYIFGTPHATPRFIPIPIGTLKEGRGDMLLPVAIAITRSATPKTVPNENQQNQVVGMDAPQPPPIANNPIPSTLNPAEALNKERVTRFGSAVISNPSNPALS